MGWLDGTAVQRGGDRARGSGRARADRACRTPRPCSRARGRLEEVDPVSDVRFEQVWKLFENDTAAVSNLNLHIHPASSSCSSGPSGCGKTTSLRMLAGLERPTFGRHLVRRARCHHAAAGRSATSRWCFRATRCIPTCRVYKNLAFGPTVRGESKQDLRGRIDEVAEVLGIEALLKRRPTELSGGQRQRVALGRALLRESQLFLLDEPLSNLDAALRVQMRAELIRLHKRLDRHDLGLRHPRPDRGDDHGRPRRGAQGRRRHAVSTPRRACTRTRPTRSWPRSSARRR